MKRGFKRIIAGALTFLILLTTAPAIFAIDNKPADSSLFIMSKECPEKYRDYAKGIVGSLLDSNNIRDPYMGSPFTFCYQDADIYYFPVYSNGIIVLTFRVFMDSNGKLNGVLSPAFADDLNSVAHFTSISNPLRICYEKRDNCTMVVFKLNDFKTDVQMLPITEACEDEIANYLYPGQQIINCASVEPIHLTSSNSTSRVLPMSITETQHNNEWCLAYCTAMVMRYKGISKTALQVMQAIHGTSVSINTRMGNDNLIPYMRGYGFCTIKSTSSPSYSNIYTTITSEVNNNRPVILSMTRTGGSHAIIALGYNDTTAAVTVWNPWYSYFETVVDLRSYSPAESTRVYSVSYYWYRNYR